MLHNKCHFLNIRHILVITLLGICMIVLDPIIRSYTLTINGNINDIFQYITRLGDAVYAVPLVMSLLIGGYYRYPQSRLHSVIGFYKTIVTMLMGTVVINLGKCVIGRSRPKLFQEFGAYHFEPFNMQYDYMSFPSGHTMTFGLLAFSMALIFPKYRFLWYASAILVGISRIILGAHYTSDVFFSLLLSYGIVYYCHYCIRIPFIDTLKQKLNL